MTRVPTMAALMLPLGACGPADEPATVNTGGVADNYAEQVAALPAGQRDGVLLRAIRDAGRNCQQVTRSEPIDPVGGAPAWAATCGSDGIWVVALNPGGVATVTAASDAARAQDK